MNKHLSTILLFATIGVVVGLLAVTTGFVSAPPGTAVLVGGVVGAGTAFLFARR